MVVDAGVSLAMVHPFSRHLDARCRSSQLEDLAPVLLEEVDCVDRTPGELQLHIRSEVVSENGVVVGDVVWVLCELRLAVSALTCAGVGVCLRYDACYLDAARENGCVTWLCQACEQ